MSTTQKQPNSGPPRTGRGRGDRGRIHRAAEGLRNLYLRWDIRRERKRFQSRKRGRPQVLDVLVTALTIPFRVVLYIGSALLRFVANLGAVLGAIWQQRQIRHLVQGTPALLALGSIVLLAAAVQKGKSALRDNYTDVSYQAIQDARHEEARIYLERLISLGGDSNENRYNLAMALEGLGNTERTLAMIQQLAPVDQAGFGPAHYWLAQHLMSAEGQATETLSLAEVHARHAISRGYEKQYSHGLLGMIYTYRGQPGEAIPHLQQAIEVAPEYFETLARAYGAVGDPAQVKPLMLQARRHYKLQSDEQPLNTTARIQYAKTHSYLKQFVKAEEILENGLKLQESEELRQTLAMVYLTWSLHVEQHGGNDNDSLRPLDYLAKALDTNPNEPQLFIHIMRVLEREGGDADDVRSFLTSKLASGESSALIYLLLGTDAGQRGDIDQAVKHLKRAWRLNSDMGVAANNLAWFLAHRSPPDFETALTLSDAVADRWPDVAPYRDTRGQILAKMGRWEDALVELQSAVKDMPDSRSTHKALATVYSALDLPELAAEHSRRASEQSVDDKE